MKPLPRSPARVVRSRAVVTFAVFAACAMELAAPGSAFAQREMGGGVVRGGRLRAGIGMMTGGLAFEGAQFPELGRNDVKIKTGVAGAPSVRLGLRYFFDKPFAIDVDGTLGFAKIEIPGAVDQAGLAPKLRLFPFGFRAHFVYRWGLSDSPNAIALQGELGTEVVGYRIQENEVAQEGEDGPVGIGKALLVSTTVAGPSAGAAVHLPIGDKLSIEIGGRYFIPTFARETPQSSGRPGGGAGISARLGGHMELTELLGVELQLRHRVLSVEFDGKGDRGATGRGVTGGQSDDRYTEGVLSVTLAI